MQEALRRFSSFFIAPTFPESGLDAAVNQIQSEYELNKSMDSYRRFQVMRSQLSASCAFKKFGTGAKFVYQAYSTKALQQKLFDFFNSLYSPHLMKLVIFGKDTVTALAQAANESFGQIQNKPVLDAQINELWKLPKLLEIVSVQKESRELILSFIMEGFHELYAKKPLDYWRNCLAYKGENSIHWMLKKHGFARNVGVHWDHLCGKFAIFEIRVELTPKGLRKYTRVCVLLLSAIGKMKASKELYEEFQLLAILKLNYIVPTSALNVPSQIAKRMITSMDRKDVILADYIWMGFDEALLNKAVNCFCKENLLITIMGPKKELPSGTLFNIKIIENFSVEEVFGSQYNWMKVPGKIEASFGKESKGKGKWVFHFPFPVNPILPKVWEKEGSERTEKTAYQSI